MQNYIKKKKKKYVSPYFIIFIFIISQLTVSSLGL